MKKSIILSIAIVSMFRIQAQTTFEISYQTSLPIADLSLFIDDYSWKGLGMEYQVFVSDYVSVGAAFGWNVFHHSGSKGQLYEINQNGLDLTLRGKKYDYFNAVPFLAVATYHLGDDLGLPRPFIGVGIGGTWIERRVDIGLISDIQSNVHFSFNPRIGLDIPLGSAQFVPSISYNLAPGLKGGPTYQYIGFNVGFKLM
jgi:hypothetical protein